MHSFWKRVKHDFDIKRQADELGVKVWQAPSFLFIVMGLVIIAAITGVYFIAKNYDSPEVIVFGEVAVVTVLFTIGNFMIRDIEEMAKANKMKTEFVSIASHQLKTPLTEISWELELLTSKFSEGLSPKQNELILGVGKAAKKMTRLVNDLLDVARIDQGRLSLEKEPVDLKEIIDEAIKGNEFLAKVSGVKIEYCAEENLPMVLGDKRKFGVVFDNLISNAIKYIVDGGVVMISVKKDGDGVVVAVKDDGVGIPEKEHDKIFVKFYRAENTSKNQTEGTGLGLFITKNIVEQSGGTIWFESKEEEGTTFWVSLPNA